MTRQTHQPTARAQMVPAIQTSPFSFYLFMSRYIVGIKSRHAMPPDAINKNAWQRRCGKDKKRNGLVRMRIANCDDYASYATTFSGIVAPTGCLSIFLLK